MYNNELIKEQIYNWQSLLKQINKNTETIQELCNESECVRNVYHYEAATITNLLGSIMQMQIGIMYKMKENEAD